MSNGPQFTVVIVLGRNIGDAPMPLPQWLAFCQDAQATLQAHGATVVQRPRLHGDGAGCCAHVRLTDGSDCCTFIAFIGEAHLFALRHDCAVLRDRYAQKAVAFIAAEGISHVV